MIRRIATLAGLFAASSVAGALGYAFIGTVWNTNRVVMHLQLGDSGGPLMDGSSSWNPVAETALALWNEQIRGLKFAVVRDSTVSIGHGDGANNVYFSDTVYGQSFEGAVAITTEWRSQGYRIEGDVVFNTQHAWNSYRGPVRSAAGGGTLYDLRRVALHEFGHVLGLDHPDEAGQNVVAIMNSRVSAIDNLRADDIAGAQALYGVETGTSTALATFTKPRKRAVSTKRARFVVRGTAKRRAEAVFVRNHRIPRKFFAASGVQRWRASVRLKRGVNRLILFVDNGVRWRKVDRIRITRR